MAYVAYLVSFLTIGDTWLLHTVLTERLARADPILVRLNLLVVAARSLRAPAPCVTESSRGDRSVSICMAPARLISTSRRARRNSSGADDDETVLAAQVGVWFNRAT